MAKDLKPTTKTAPVSPGKPLPPFVASIVGGRLIINMELSAPVQSKSNKSFVVASTHGIIPTDLEVEGRTLQIGVNAFYKA